MSRLPSCGSDITGSKTVALATDNQVDIVSAQSTSEQHSRNSSSSASLGVGYGTDGFVLSASAGGARGKADGSDVTQVNSHISGANKVSIQSGGDTNILGGVVKGKRVVTDIGGDLNIESRQDTAKFDSRQQSLGGSASVGAGKVGGSLSASQSNVNADYASVSERSGIQAGDGGFDVKVKGRTDLVGGAITSTQKAVDEGRNSFDSQSLTTRDIQNRDNFSASGLSLSGGYSTGGTGKPAEAGKPAPNLAGGVNGAAAGMASASGKNSSTTTSGISGIAGDKAVRTGDGSGGLAKTFDADKVNQEVGAQLQITSTFGQQAARTGGEYANGKAVELRAQGNEAEAAKWDEGGAYRVGMHTVLAGLTGGVQGALGAASSQLAIDAVGKQVAATDLPLGLKTALVAAAGTAIGAAAGGGVGAGAVFNATVNNYLTVADLSKKETTKERQDRSLANNAAVENACLNADAKTCNGALSTVATDIKELNDYKKRLEENSAQTTDGKTAAQLSIEVGTVDKQIESAKNAVRVGLMALDNGNFDIRTMSDSELVGMGVAFDAAGAAELRAASKVKTIVSNLADNAKTDAANAAAVAAAKISNNANRDGGISDPSRPMSVSGPWKSAAELTPVQANALAAARLPPDAIILNTASADAANAIIVRDNPRYQPSYMPSTNITEFTSSSPGEYVRVSGERSQPTANWIMKASDIAGLTPEQIAAKFALPAVPTQIGNVTIPAGAKLQASVANGIMLGNNPGGGGVQFFIPQPPTPSVFSTWFTNLRPIK